MNAIVGRTRNPIAIRRIDIDDHADVRYLHIRSLTEQSFGALSEPEVAAFAAFVRSPSYSDSLLAEEIHGAFADGQLVATAGWQFNGDDGRVARITSVFVHPLFSRLGIGRRLLGEVETRALRSGFALLGTSVTLNAVGFFEKLGYREASRGVRMLTPDCSIPVAFMRKSVPQLMRARTPPAA
jgi:ribosomal protein S18 acetylase RimI-like enzyme